MNLLSTETSPYLRQHENNPVYWMPWGETALAKAAAEDKPILLSIGYAACHWCHVMAHESFEDPHIAALMNEHYICIKVDREERPDIDALYQQSLALMGKQGGWPLTIVLTPEGKSFWGGTYFPPVAMQGLPAFRDVLTGIADAWNTERDKIDHNIGTLHTALESLQVSTRGSGQISRQWFDQIAGALESRIDPVHGGFGASPKFPQLPTISFLWDFHIHTGRDSLKSAVIQTLTSLCQGGIYDHIGGGIARYAVDQEWLVPHFEKMLSDNALFIGMLSEVYRETKNPLFKSRVAQTVNWLKREMMVEEKNLSAFAASLDADSEGREGAFYVWTTDEIEKALGDDALSYMETYDITRFGNWHEGGEGVSIPNRLQSPAWLGDEAEDILAEQNEKLLDIRLDRELPGRDDKILADWNGWMIEALTRASFAFDEPDYLELARHVFDFIRSHMMLEDGRLYHSFCEGKPGPHGMLDDYAAMGLAALALYEAGFDADYLADAKRWAGIIVSSDFYDENSGLFFMGAAGDNLLPLRIRPVDDSVLASGNGAAAQFLTRLGVLAQDSSYTDKARKMVEAISGDLARGYFTRCSFLKAALLLDHGLQLQAPVEFNGVISNMSLPLTIRLPAKNDKAEVCTTRQCLPAVETAEALDKLLREERVRHILVSANDD